MALIGIALLIGIISTIQLHIAKAMERQGIEIFDQIRAKLGKSYDKNADIENTKKPLIYIVGLVLNNTIVIYAIVANVFGPPALYTSMFGVGLIALMLYSKYFLKESIKPIEYIGSLSIIAGTLIIGVEAIFRPEYNMATADLPVLYICLGVYFAVFGSLLAFSIKTHKGTGLLFGLFAGGCGGIDPVLKSVGQSLGAEQTGILPSSPIGWFFFLLSFGPSTAAFLITQWGFARKARASVLVPSYNTSYIIVPLIFQTLILSAFVLTVVTWAGVAAVIVGIFLMQAFKDLPIPHSAETGKPAPEEIVPLPPVPK